MFSLFRKNDPYLYVLYAAVIIISRICFYLIQGELAIPADFNQSIIFDGNLMAELPAVWHCILNILFVLINAILLNLLIHTNNALRDNNYLGGFIFILLMSSSPALFLFSPALVGITFILVALNLVLAHVKQRASEENIFFTGFFLGLAGLIYSPYFCLILALVLIYFFYTRTIPRRYVLAIFGFLFPYLVSYALTFFIPFQFEFNDLLGQIDAFELYSNMSPTTYAFILLPLLLSIFELGNNFSGKKMSNHQLHFQRVMFILLIAAFIIASLWNVPMAAIELLVIPIAYFVAHSIMGSRKVWIREVVSLMIFLAIFLPYLLTANL